jgi:hypothetical protein
MDMVDNKPKETEPLSDIATPAPVTPPVSKPEAAPVAPATPVTAAPAPVELFKGVIPTTKANAQGGWNRFAGYKPGDAKNKQKDRREGRGRR